MAQAPQYHTDLATRDDGYPQQEPQLQQKRERQSLDRQRCDIYHHDRDEGAVALSEIAVFEPASRQHQQHPSGFPPSQLPPLASGSSKFATQLYTISYLVFFSILGTLARVGLQALTFYPGAPVVTGVLWANVGGCLLMGFFVEEKNLFREEWSDSAMNENGGNDISDHDDHDDDEDGIVGKPASTPQIPDGESVKRYLATKKTIPLYIGLTTGFCGSFTSFSSFMRDAFLTLSNDLPSYYDSSGSYQSGQGNENGNLNSASSPSRNGGYSFMAVTAVLITTVSLSMSALFFGTHLALASDPWTRSLRFRPIRKVLDCGVVLLAWGCWLGAVFLSIWPPDRTEQQETWRGRALFAVIFAPPGCLLRYYISLYLNPRFIKTFPLGTFVVNIFGTAVEGMCYDLQHSAGIGALPSFSASSNPSTNRIASVSSIQTSCQILQGLMDGFCGCVTTVSTWIAELKMSLSCRRYAYLYGALSVGLGLGLLVIIMGSLRWTIGFIEPVC